MNLSLYKKKKIFLFFCILNELTKNVGFLNYDPKKVETLKKGDRNLTLPPSQSLFNGHFKKRLFF